MAKLASRPWQDARGAGRVETVQRIGADLPDFTGGKDIVGRPARPRGQHVGGITVVMYVDMGPFFGPGLDGNLCAAVIGGLHGLVFAWIEPVLPICLLRRGLAYGAILWTLMAVYFEFHTPFNMFGEPPLLVSLELVFWVFVLAVEGLTLSVLYGAGRGSVSQARHNLAG